jgi:hypothetical protein
VPQNFTPACEYFPQLEQRTDAEAGWFTITCVGAGSLVTAQIMATSQPTRVQPRRTFSAQSAGKFLFFLPIIEGSKYRTAAGNMMMIRTTSQWKGENSPIAF